MVINVVSVDQRIKQEARRTEEAYAFLDKQTLERLRAYINDDVWNMRERCGGSRATPRDRVGRLHMKTYDDTYHDYAKDTKRQRTRTRIEALLMLCRGDKDLLLREYKRALDRIFPLDEITSHFEWNPRLIKVTLRSGKPGVSIKHVWRRRKKV